MKSKVLSKVNVGRIFLMHEKRSPKILRMPFHDFADKKLMTVAWKARLSKRVSSRPRANNLISPIISPAYAGLAWASFKRRLTRPPGCGFLTIHQRIVWPRIT